MRHAVKLLLLALVCAVALSGAPLAADGSAPKPVVTESIDGPGREPYQQYQSMPAKYCDGGVCDMLFRKVPPGKRLIITYINVDINSDATAYPDAYVTDQVSFTLFLPVISVLNPSTSRTILGGPITFYVDPGGQPMISARGVQYAAEATVVGYLVPVP